MTITRLFHSRTLTHEFRAIGIVFCLLLALPIISVSIIYQTGFQQVSDALVETDQQEGVVYVRSPKDGGKKIGIQGPFAQPTTGVVTLRFGESSLYQPFHAGIDIADQLETPVVSLMSGKVRKVASITWGYGTYVVIDHGNNITTIYAHLHTVAVRVGDIVQTGQLIGSQGSTGWSTGTHLHFEVRIFGVPVDPEEFFNIQK